MPNHFTEFNEHVNFRIIIHVCISQINYENLFIWEKSESKHFCDIKVSRINKAYYNYNVHKNTK